LSKAKSKALVLKSCPTLHRARIRIATTPKTNGGGREYIPPERRFTRLSYVKCDRRLSITEILRVTLKIDATSSKNKSLKFSFDVPIKQEEKSK
jgi:hypothetical protein